MQVYHISLDWKIASCGQLSSMMNMCLMRCLLLHENYSYYRNLKLGKAEKGQEGLGVGKG